MPKKIEIEIKETASELKELIKKSKPSYAVKVNMLYLLKTQNICYVKQLSQVLFKTQKTVSKWINGYQTQGISYLTESRSGGKRFSKVSENVDKFIAQKLNDSKNGITSYVQLQVLINKELSVNLPYSTVYYHCVTHYQSKLKVAARSHVKKDPKAQELFLNAT